MLFIFPPSYPLVGQKTPLPSSTVDKVSTHFNTDLTSKKDIIFPQVSVIKTLFTEKKRISTKKHFPHAPWSWWLFSLHENPPQNPSVARKVDSKLPKFRVVLKEKMWCFERKTHLPKRLKTLLPPKSFFGGCLKPKGVGGRTEFTFPKQCMYGKFTYITFATKIN